MDDGGDDSASDDSHSSSLEDEYEDESLSDEEEEEETSKFLRWLDRVAVFGDSQWALFGSFLVLLVAVGAALLLNNDDLYGALEKRYRYRARLGPVPTIDPPRIFHVDSEDDGNTLVTDEIRAAYAKDGVVAVRGLLTDDMLQRLDRASAQLVHEQHLADKKRSKKRTGTQFHMVRMGAAFLDPPTLEGGDDNVGPSEEDQQDSGLSAFREVALMSATPKFAADLLGLSEEKNDTLRVMRDIFLTKDDEEYVCGWHVDDLGFWPATASSPGVNAWIAIDDMPIGDGGGFALAVGSHSASWRHDAHRAIGSTLTFPPEGFQSVADMFDNRVGAGTCNLETEAPHIHKRMEEMRRVYEVKRGDILFHERWLFHRTVPFDRRIVESHKNEHDRSLVYRRYSVRYGPGSSEIPRGYGTELSVLWKKENGGRTADEVAALDGPWYPKCWPAASQEEMGQLLTLVHDKFSIAEEIRMMKQKEMKPYLKKAAKSQHDRSIRG